MPIKTKSGKWKWGNIERDSKKELVQTVYGIWKKNGSKGSFSDFLKGTHESIVNEYAGNKYFVKVDPRVQKYGQDSGYETLHSDDGKILGFKGTRGDCVIRALALATGLSYLNVAKKLHIELDDKGDVPKDYGGTKWATVFKFFHQTAPSPSLLGMKQNTTVKEFARTISRHAKFKNKYLIVGCVDPSWNHAHAVFIKNGRYYDSWDCGDWIVVDVFDATNERGLNAHDYRNIVQIRRGTKKRYKKQTAVSEDIEINESSEESYFVTDLDYNKHIKPVLDIFKSWPHVNVENITKHDKDVKLKWFGLYTGHKLEDIVALIAIQTNFDDYTINIANICSNGHGNGKKLLDNIIDYYSKTDRKYLVWFADPNGGEKLKNYYRSNFPDAEETEEKNEWWQTSKFTLKLKESVEPKDKFFKVKKNGKEIGKYGLSFYDDIKAVGIGDLEVYPEFRNKGYGTKIIKNIVNRYKNDYDKIYCFVDKDNKDAIRLYKRLGKVSDKVTYSQKIGDYEYKNTNGQHYVEFYNKLKESMNTEDTKRYAYHCTNVDPEIIKKEGWKVGNDGFTFINHFKDLYDKYLPQVPVFISRIDVPVWSVKSKYCLKINITDLDLYPDFGSLPDTGAEYDPIDESFWWEDKITNKDLLDYVKKQKNGLVFSDRFSGEDSLKTLGTACIAGADLNRLKDRGIVEYVSKDGKKIMNESYERPYTLDQIKQNYGQEIYDKLKDDPVHKWRAETGIELIHHEPTKEEFERIVKNWDLMTPEQKKQSDEFSNKIFGNNNERRIDLLRKEYDFEVGDKVKIRSGIRCRQSGHTGTIVRIDPPGTYDYDMHGWSSFIVKMDDPNLGTVGFQSGNIEKINESVVLEDKTAMIKKLVLPDISSDNEKNAKKELLIKWFKEHPHYEDKVDWNKWKTLTSDYFDDLINNYKKSNREKKEEVREPSGKDPKSFFENVEKRKFKIVDENDDWLFVAPLNHEAAMFCDDKECGGGSAEWCIGMKGRVSYWNKYISDGSKFIMAFSKHFDTMPIKELFTNLKFMFQENPNKEYLIWDQTDVSDGIEIAKTKFEKNFDDFRELFSKVDLHEYETSMWHWSERTAESAVIDSITLPDAHILKLAIPKETTRIDDEACQLGETSEYTEVDELVLNKKLKSIGYLSFVEINIKNLTYDDGCELSSIGHYAFSGCDFSDTLDLTGLDKLKEIGDYAFQNNRYVKSVKLPPNIITIGDKVFDGCKNLLHLEIPSRFFDPEHDYYKLSKICGNINYDDIDIVPIDENGKPIEHDEN